MSRLSPSLGATRTEHRRPLRRVWSKNAMALPQVTGNTVVPGLLNYTYFGQ